VTAETLKSTNIIEIVEQIKDGDNPMHSSKIKKLKKDLLEHWKLIREVEAPVLNLKDF